MFLSSAEFSCTLKVGELLGEERAYLHGVAREELLGASRPCSVVVEGCYPDAVALVVHRRGVAADPGVGDGLPGSDSGVVDGAAGAVGRSPLSPFPFGDGNASVLRPQR